MQHFLRKSLFIALILPFCTIASSDTGNAPNIVLLHNSQNDLFFHEISKKLNAPEIGITESKFNSGEIDGRLTDPEGIKNKTVYVCHSFIDNPKKNLYEQNWEVILMIRQAQTLGAKEVKVLALNYLHSRQDREVRKGEMPISNLVGELYQRSGTNSIITVDMHSQRTLNHLEKIGMTYTNISSASAFMPTFSKLIQTGELTNPVIVSPDQGGRVRAQFFCDLVNQTLQKPKQKIGLAVFNKERLSPGKVGNALLIEGSVEGHEAIIVDDMIDTGGTLVKVAKELIENGAKKVYAVACYGIFSGNAIETLDKSPIERIFVTDALPNTKDCPNKCTRVSLIDILVNTIRQDMMKSQTQDLTQQPSIEGE